MAIIIDGKALAMSLREKIAEQVSQLKQTHGVTPGLAVVLIGDDPASQVYVRNKKRATIKAGMNSFEHVLDKNATQQEVLELIARLNADPAVHGILVQSPPPPQIDEKAVIAAIAPHKDVDGFHVQSAGALMVGSPGFVACTPRGCVALLEAAGISLRGKHAVVIGRSNIVGKPAALLLPERDCTVTVCHSRTVDLPSIVRTADIVVAAVGRPEMVRGDWIKPGAAVIDVGINRVDGKIVGDVAFEEAKEVAGYITPVPGGVGPMTIAMLLQNTLEAAQRAAAN